MAINEVGQDNKKQNDLSGLHYATVMDNNDPMKLKRLLINVPEIMNTDGQWALPVGDDYGGGVSNGGIVNLPPIGATVIVEFQDESISHPLWRGTQNGYQTPLPSKLLENYPNRAGIGWPDGTYIYYDRDAKSFVVEDSFHNKVVFDSSGITITTPIQVTVTTPTTTMNTHLIVNGTIDCSGDVTGAGISLDTHVHTGVITGPSLSGPPA